MITVDKALEEVLTFYLQEYKPTLLCSDSRYTSLPDHVNIVGVPLDDTVSNRPGTRFAPQFLRQVSPYVEYCTSEGSVIPCSKLHDIGDLALLQGQVEKNLDRIYRVFQVLTRQDTRYLVIGGEHLITYPIVKALCENYEQCLLIIFDAHLDLRDEWPYGQRYSHATHVRRSLEELENLHVVHVGVHAFDIEELKYARECGRDHVFTLQDVLEAPFTVLKYMSKLVREINVRCVYLSIDVDVFSPSLMSYVSNPEGIGMPYTTFRKLVSAILQTFGKYVKIVDVCEYNPLVDRDRTGATTILKLMSDIVYSWLVGLS